MTWSDIVAVYAALLSTIIFVWQILGARPSVKVTVTHGMDQIEGKYRSGVYVHITNPSGYKVHVKSLSVMFMHYKPTFLKKIFHILKYKRNPHYVGWVYDRTEKLDTGLPVSIEPHNSHGVFISDIKLEEILKTEKHKKIKISVQDALWSESYSNVIDVAGVISKISQ